MSGRIVRRRLPEGQSPAIQRLPVVGKIKIGERAENGLPRSLDYFVPRASDVHNRRFHETFGNKPNSLVIIFPTNENEQVAEERFEGRDKSGRLWITGDGKNWRLWSPEKKDYINLDSDIPEQNEILRDVASKNKIELHEVVTIRFLIPAIKGLFGIWELSTKGKKSSNSNLIQVIDSVKQMTGGYIRGIPMDLSVKYATSQKPGSSSRYPVLSLTPNVSAETLEELSSFLQMGIDLPAMLTEARIAELMSAPIMLTEGGPDA